MTTITLSPDRHHPRNQRRFAAFTLAEVMIAASISSFILAGVMSTFLFLGRSGANIANYNDMEAQARNALELFAEDTRQASAISWTADYDVTLTVDSIPIRYVYDKSRKTFFRRNGSTGQLRALVTGIITFQYKAYGINGGASLPLSSASDLTAANKMTKQLQVSLESTRNTRTVSTASNTVLSARFILRNKRVTT